MSLLSTIIHWSLRNRLLVLVLTLIAFVLGIQSVLKLPVDALPDITNVQVQIITSTPAFSPLEVEQYLTIPIERALAGVPHSIQVRSLSKHGLSVVTVVFEEGTSIYFARQQINERLREVERNIPAGYGKPEIGPITTGLGEIFQFTLHNDHLNLMELKELLDWTIIPQLRTVPGVTEVNSFGGEERQYKIILDPKRLQAAGISIAEVAKALQRSNANTGGGYIEHNQEQWIFGSEGLVKDLEDLKRVVIGATPQGVPITVATVGEVQFGRRLRMGAATANGQGEVVIGVALMLLGENPRTVTQSIKDKLALLQPSLPPGTRIEPFYDRMLFIDQTLWTVTKNLIEGALLVIAVLFLLLGDWKAGLVVSALIPLSFLFALTMMNLFHISGNLISLGAIDFGLIVDGAVIIVENAVRRLGLKRKELGRALTSEERITVVQDAATQVRTASGFGEAIIAVVYLPILTLTGTEGKLFQPMAITVLFTLAGAFVFSLTLIPVLVSYVIVPSTHLHETKIFNVIQRLYQHLLHKTVHYPKLAGLCGGALLLLSTAIFAHLGAEFVPTLDEGDILIYEARRLPGISLTESLATTTRLEKAFLTVPEVSQAISRTGAPQIATDPMGVEQTDIYILLKERKKWREGFPKEKIAEEIIRSAQHLVPEVNGSISQPIQMRTHELIAGVRSDVALMLYGPRLEQLTELAQKMGSILSTIPGVVDLRIEQIDGLKYLRIIPDRAKLARYGLTIEDINQLTDTIAIGHPVGMVLEGDRHFSIVIQIHESFQESAESLLNLPLKAITGQMIPLGDVAAIRFTPGPAQISRDQQSRRLSIEFNIRQRDMLSAVEEAQQKIHEQVKIPIGYWIEWGGQFDHYLTANRRLALIIPLVLGLILLLLWLGIGSLRDACLIFAHIPFAAIGGVLALAIRGIPFSISGGIGFIALFGVAVLNGIVLIGFAHELERIGFSRMEAILKSAKERLRPVLMTAVVASLGFMPMALSIAPGAEIQRPLATVVIGGILSSTLLTIFLLPVIYAATGPKRTAI
ncbi:efflux RND transporter permease subunit [Pajaroellobacter abortibovis]|uniref:Cation transporter n=1 Tax=Pajaroellobacter abortibovis TaxID=1882918 RepID=A0A1L6MXA5_9BACT|nr:CusA/CzcA family heavy metal efflux RND transporter [Pajaroellobacter abortibovis]APS00184.1 cation transporter [Pajaroellobacter abortibovis]